MSVWSKTESRSTLWADSFPTVIGTTVEGTQGVIEVVYDGLEPVAEADADTFSFRYGGIEVPIMFANFETNDLRYWSSTQGAN